MERIAIISDIHGNLEALKAVLQDIEYRHIDRIFCLGDIIAKGNHPKECLDLIKEKCEVIIEGNCEYFYCQNHDLTQFSDLQQKRIIWNQSLLTKEDREFLLNLPYSYEFYMSGSLIRLFHATPTIINDMVASLDDLDKKYQMFLPSEETISDKIADIIIYGHTHTPYLDKFYNKTLLNCGSVGNPIDVIRQDERDSNVQETIKASYLILEGAYQETQYKDSLSFQFVRVPYDIQQEIKDNEENIEKEDYINELTQGKYRNMKRIYKMLNERKIKF